MVKINILGSCVTRDAFSKDSKTHIKNYYARTSIISLMSQPVRLNIEDIDLDSNFQKKCVFQDLSKTSLNGILQDPNDFLIIDLIDERFNLIQMENSIATMSNEFRSSNLMNKFNFMVLDRFHDDVYRLWKISVEKFFEEIFKVYHPSQVILHKTFWRKKYLNKQDEIIDFPDTVLKGIEKQNTLLDSYYRFIESFIPKMNVIDMTESTILSSEKHIWGLSPYHFEDRYYNLFNEKLSEIILDNIKEALIENTQYVIKENELVITVNQVKDSKEFLRFAYYVKSNGNITYKGWYDSNPNFRFNIKDISLEENEVIVFVRDKNDNQITYNLKI